jgi:uncharacterized membrane protein
MNLARATYAVILAGAILWCAAILLAPLLAASWSPLAEYVYRFFQPICHQRAERSFFLFGQKLAVCVRCSSMYFAFLLGGCLIPFTRGLGTTRTPSRGILLLTLLPIVFEVAAEWVGLYTSTVWTRAITGGMFGYVVSLYIFPTAIEGMQHLGRRTTTTLHTTTINKQ